MLPRAMASKKTAPAKRKAASPAKRAPAKTPARRAAAPRKAAKPTKASARPFSTTSPELAFAHFLPLALAVPTEGLEAFRLDAALVCKNLERGVAAVRAELPTLKKELPGCPIHALLELPALGLALTHAASRVVHPTSTPEVEKRLALMLPMREAALRQLEVFALIDLIPAHVPAAIRKGTGALDAAQDALAIPSVFQDSEELIGHRHPFTSAMLKKLGEDGDWLLERLAPLEEAREQVERSPEAIVQSQIWALIVERHDALRQAGAVLFGLKALDGKVPPLGQKLAQSPH